MDEKSTEAVIELAVSMTARQWFLISTIIGVNYPYSFGEKVNLLKARLGGYNGYAKNRTDEKEPESD